MTGAEFLPFIGSLFNGMLQTGSSMHQNTQNQWFAEQQQQWSENMQQNQNQWNLEQWNRQNRYNEQWWDNQNEYNLEMWNMQNQYNSPIEQMARLKEAGLNPHLMYGQGSPGTAQQLTAPGQNADKLMSADAKGYSRAEAKNILKGINVFKDYQSLKHLQARTSNVERDTINKEMDTYLKASQEALYTAQINKSKFDYDLAKELRETTLEAAIQNVEQMKAVIANRAKDTELKDASLKLRSMGATESDNLLLRMFLNLLGGKEGINGLFEQYTK